MSGIEDGLVTGKTTRVGSDFIALLIVDVNAIRVRTHTERLAGQIVGDGVTIGIEGYKTGFAGPCGGMNQGIVPGIGRKEFEFFQDHKVKRCLVGNAMNSVVFIKHPFMESLINGFEILMMHSGVEEGVPQRTNDSFDSSLFIASGNIAEAYIKAIVPGEVHEGGVVDNGISGNDNGFKIIVSQCARMTAKGLEGHDMALDEELEGITAK